MLGLTSNIKFAKRETKRKGKERNKCVVATLTTLIDLFCFHDIIIKLGSYMTYRRRTKS